MLLLMRRALLLPLVLLGLTACGNENVVNKLKPKIVALPETIDFGAVVVDYESTAILEIINEGQAELTIDSLRFEGGADGVFAHDFVGPVELEPDAVQSVTVSFTPPTYLSYAETLIINSDDPDESDQALPIRLFGEGVDGPKPDIELPDLSIDFGTVDFGSTDLAEFTIYNVGEADLEILDFSMEGSGDFALLDDPLGRTVGAGTTFKTAITYTPAEAEEGDDALITITTNDPDEPVVEVVVLGNGGKDYELPIATFNCPTEVATLSEIDFDASESYDPEGYEPLFYTWSLDDQPQGSRRELQSEGETASFSPDLAGSYTVSLVVTNLLGVDSTPTECTFEAIPEDAIHVEMFWSDSDSDLDVHLAQNGAEIFEDDDASYCNPNPDWGTPVDKTDDPSLDLDDQNGYGPENINIEEPQEGDYKVRVHYYADLGADYVTATVRIYLRGTMVAETTQLMEADQVWDVGTITWPDADSGAEGTWTADSAALYDPETTGCY